MNIIDGGITAAKGFMAGSTRVGLKKEKGKRDMAMIFSESPCAAAGTFTSNRVKAAPVVWDRKIVRETGRAQAVVVNAGIANAATGEEGLALCRRTAEAAAGALGLSPGRVLLGSTGVIGPQLPLDRLGLRPKPLRRLSILYRLAATI